MKRFLRSLVRRPSFWIAIAAIAVAVWVRCGPLPAGLLDEPSRGSTTVVDRYGEVLYESRSARGTRGESIDTASLPPDLEHATLAAEDARFKWHIGVDPI